MSMHDRNALAADVLDLAKFIHADGDEGTLTLNPSGLRWVSLCAGFDAKEVERVARTGRRIGVFALSRPLDDERGYPTIALDCDVGDLTAEKIAEALA